MKIEDDRAVSMNKTIHCASKGFQRQSQLRIKHVYTHMLVLLVCCKEAGLHIVLPH